MTEERILKSAKTEFPTNEQLEHERNVFRTLWAVRVGAIEKENENLKKDIEKLKSDIHKLSIAAYDCAGWDTHHINYLDNGQALEGTEKYTIMVCPHGFIKFERSYKCIQNCDSLHVVDTEPPHGASHFSWCKQLKDSVVHTWSKFEKFE